MSPAEARGVSAYPDDLIGFRFRLELDGYSRSPSHPIDRVSGLSQRSGPAGGVAGEAMWVRGHGATGGGVAARSAGQAAAGKGISHRDGGNVPCRTSLLRLV